MRRFAGNGFGRSISLGRVVHKDYKVSDADPRALGAVSIYQNRRKSSESVGERQTRVGGESVSD